MKTILSTTLLVAAFAACATHPPQIAPVSLAPEQVMAAMTQAGTPGPEHASLAELAGEWDLAIEIRMGKDQPWTKSSGASTYRIVMDGRYVLEEMTSTFMGMPYKGFNILGYDNLADMYTSSWRDTMSTWNVDTIGSADTSGKIITFRGRMVDVVSPRGRPMRSVLTMESKDSYQFEMFDTIDDEELKVMSIKAKRK